MYKIKSLPAKTFATDRYIKLPRFQRKQTWDEKKNFELCISVFKEFPIGVCILSRDVEKKEHQILLDGRQRRNALDLMYKDPENIYLWAKKYIGFKKNDQPMVVKDKFDKKIQEYLETEDSEDPTSESEEPNRLDIDESEGPIDDSTPFFDLEEDSYGSEGLDFLREIVLLIHNRNSKGSGFTIPFYFGSFAKDLPYIEGGTDKLSSSKLKVFIDNYRNYCDNHDSPYSEANNFYQFFYIRKN